MEYTKTKNMRMAFLTIIILALSGCADGRTKNISGDIILNRLLSLSIENLATALQNSAIWAVQR